MNAVCRQPGWTRFRWRAVAAAASLAALLGACAAVPSQQMSDARRALGAAREAQSERLAPGLFARASATLDRASEALRAGDYEAARTLAAEAHSQAMQARSFAERVSATEASIDAARREGRPWEGARQLLDEAGALAEEGDLERALERLDRADALAR